MCLVKNGLEKLENLPLTTSPPVRQNYTMGSNLIWSLYLTHNNGPLLKFGQNHDRLKHAMLTDVGHKLKDYEIDFKYVIEISFEVLDILEFYQTSKCYIHYTGSL